MSALLLRSSLRYMLRHPWQLGLAIVGVALGVAVVVSIDIAASSARRAFDLSTETLTGRATHRIQGNSPLFSDSVYRLVRVQERIRKSAPILEEFVTLPAAPGRSFRLLGVDPFAEAPFRPFLHNLRNTSSQSMPLTAQSRAAILSAPVAQSLGVAVGDTVQVSLGARRTWIVVARLVEPADERVARAMESLIVMDISGVQDIIGRSGVLSAIDLLLPDEQTAQRLRSALPPGVELTAPATRSAGIAGMTNAFNVNLAALSMLALIVGMFLIYNTMTFSVVQRRPFIGRLRAVGVTRSEIFRVVLSEAAAIGTIGTLLGCALGIALGRVLLVLVTRTINDLYYVVSVRDIALDPLVLAKGLLLGIAASVLAALAPAREATRSSPRSVFSRSFTETALRQRAPVLAVVGAGLFGFGVLLLFVSDVIVLSYIGLLCILLGCTLAVPLLTMWGAVLLAKPATALLGSIGRMAARGIASTLGRTSVAIAALMIAISATIGVGLMVDSFRYTVAHWLEMQLTADVYISQPGIAAHHSSAVIAPELFRRLTSVSGIVEVNSIKVTLASYRDRPFRLVATRIGNHVEQSYRLNEELPQAWQRFHNEQVVFVSEPFSWRFGIGVGDTITLQTDRGRAPFLVAAVYKDFSTDIGAVLFSHTLYSRFWNNTDVTGLSVFAAPGVHVDSLIAALRRTAGAENPLLIRSNRVLREASLELFDRTFAITSVLRLLTIVVAFVGVLSSLMALQLERAREIGILRATGMTPRQVWKLITTQTGLMGLLAGVFALPVGLVLSLVLIYVINRRSFGWTLEFVPTVDIPLQAVLLAVVAALLAGVYPAWKMARTSPSLALRSE